TTLLPQAQCAFLHITTPQPAFHMLPQEYPPLTLLAFSLPLLAPLPYYALVFALLMVLVAALIAGLLARSGARRAAPLFLLYLVLGTIAMAQERFDLLPAACTLVCVLAAERGRWRTAYLALALGVLLKLYPIVMLPALFLAEQHSNRTAHPYVPEQQTSFSRVWESVRHWRWQNSLLCMSLIGVVMGGFALLNFNEALVGPLAYFVQRPAQIESLASSVIWAGSHFGLPYTINFQFGSLNVESNLMRLISPIDTLLTLTGILSVLWLQWRNKLDLAQTLVALVCILMTTGKVFSPQYLIWLFPLLTYIYARGNTNRVWLSSWAVISLLTTGIYIIYYSHLPDPSTAAYIIATLPGFFEMVAVRNVLLLVMTLAFLAGWWGVRRQHA
ncbi:MAG: glycosyltransferase 87 family protein, partial [Ktedonobacteraceae bacterium]